MALSHLDSQTPLNVDVRKKMLLIMRRMTVHKMRHIKNNEHTQTVPLHIEIIAIVYRVHECELGAAIFSHLLSFLRTAVCLYS